ncbi:MAG: DUF4400 domain-containing protein [Duodenibacillus sp.]|nr:DUF4400 domain-containing protein [Duodenibacillus sp.]
MRRAEKAPALAAAAGLALALELFAALAVVPRERLIEEALAEARMTEAALGARAHARALAFAEALAGEEGPAPGGEPAEGARGPLRWAAERRLAAGDWMYWMSYRAHASGQALALTLPAAAAAAAHGALARRIRLAGFGFASPVVRAMGRRLTQAGLAALLVMALMPLRLSPWLLLAPALTAALGAALSAAHAQRRL